MTYKSLFLSPARISAAAILGLVFMFSLAWAEPIPATLKQGSLHGFLLLKSQDGKVIAVGDEIDSVHGDIVRSELVFHFRDGSLDDEVAVFRQGASFALLRDHHIQKGPSFPQPLDLTIDAAKGDVTWQLTKDGKTEEKNQHMDLPADLANGLLPFAIENYPAGAAEMKLSFLATDPNPRLVQLSIAREGEDRIEIGGAGRRVARYRMHIEIGGVAGAIAPILGKEPTDIFFWATEDAVPVVLKTEGALYMKGPNWTMVFASPSWPRIPASQESPH